MVVRQAVDVFLRRELPGDQDGVSPFTPPPLPDRVKPTRKKPFWSQALRAAGDIVPELSIVADKTVK